MFRLSFTVDFVVTYSNGLKLYHCVLLINYQAMDSVNTKQLKPSLNSFVEQILSLEVWIKL